MRTILITGATSGIGLEAAVQLATNGDKLILVGRDPGRLRDAEQRVPGSDSLQADFASQASVRKLAAAVNERYDHIDVLVNNAGTVFARRTVTEDGIEATFAVNHLAAFLLTDLIKDRITERIVNVSSVGHYNATMDFDDFGFEHGYQVMRAYRRSKLANVMFTRSLAKRIQGVTANALHPGAVATRIWSHAPWFARPVLAVVKRTSMDSPEVGAKHIVYLVVSPDVADSNGLYFDDDKPREPSALARDDAVAERLWTESERLTSAARH
jgi:retinol dehydrogenase 14